MTNYFSKLLYNSRFYILLSSLLISVAVFVVLRSIVGEGQVFQIRLQQVFGLLAVLYLYAAIIVSPLAYVFGKNRMSWLIFARRAIGVSAFYFAVLHGSIALWGQFGGIDEIRYLPTVFLWSFGAGAVGIVVLGLMASTSFDKVIQYMTPKRWKMLHRLVYIASILILLHVWSIGTHLAYGSFQALTLLLLAIIIGLELYRVTNQLNTKYMRLGRLEYTTLFLSFWAVCMVAVVATPSFIGNYHDRHENHHDYVEKGESIQ